MTHEEIMQAQEYLRQVEWDLLSCGRSYEQAGEEMIVWEKILLPDGLNIKPLPPKSGGEK